MAAAASQQLSGGCLGRALLELLTWSLKLNGARQLKLVMQREGWIAGALGAC